MNNALLKKIENTIDDLKSADTISFERHINKLSQLLESDEIKSISEELQDMVDFMPWINELVRNWDNPNIMMDWPTDNEIDELGFVIELTHHLALGFDFAIDLSDRFYPSENPNRTNLQNMVAQVYVPFRRDFISYVKEKTAHSEGPTESLETPTSQSGTTVKSDKIFVVHGHDEAAMEKMARFLERIGMKPVILHEQASENKTVIEKFEKHSDVEFAVVLLTPDDEGGKNGKNLQPRARQNVIFELGYFVGNLGRSNVAVLKKDDVEFPSDIVGVVYIPFDEHGAWKQKLCKELQSADYQIDWEKAMN